MDHLRSHAEALEAELNQAVSLGVRFLFICTSVLLLLNCLSTRG